ncbi:HET-C-related protein [Flavobacterium ajazii]|uniref:HET-C-related protein n=1 Tax=Flavobacterium ajazii TaxID=2692318 RepID=UPI0013D7A0E3|nr:HET-C-related protein [Flavobacterium ajazii]
MGITKQAKNITIQAKTSYTVRAKELVEIADKVNYEAHKENLVLNSNASIDLKGEENGVVYSDYSPPEIEIEESEFKLESKFALEQLFSFAKKDSKAMFCMWMSSIFGEDVPLEAYEKLYQDASDEKESINPQITVVLSVPGFGATYYTGEKEKFKNHIIISEGFINKAIKDNVNQKALLLALVEEFGHHLDYLLRYEYSDKGGDAQKDEGAKFSARMNRKYKKYYIDPLKVKEQHYATATIDGAENKLVWDFADLHQKLKEFVDNREDKDDNFYAGYEFFGAGIGDTMHGLGHQHIENVALGRIARYADDAKGVNTQRSQIYFGNWLRDFSQFVDPMVVRPAANALNMLSDDNILKFSSAKESKKLLKDLLAIRDVNPPKGNKNYSLPYLKYTTKKTFLGAMPTKIELAWQVTSISPVKLSREAITSLVELLGVKEFGDKLIKDDEAESKPQDFFKYLKTFRKQYAPVTSGLLGVYKPQEHIDNPAALHPGLICEANKKKNKACPPADFNHTLDNSFVKDPIDLQWNHNKATGTKNYIRGFECKRGKDGKIESGFESAFDCFIDFINKSNPDTVEGRMNFGAALHILEDYFAHSNFTEIAIMKVYDPEVFPWTNMPTDFVKGQLKKHKADSATNSFAKHSEIDLAKVKFRTLNNSDLWTDAVRNYMEEHKDKKSKPQQAVQIKTLDGINNIRIPLPGFGTHDQKSHPSDYYRSLGHENPVDNKGLYYAAAACAIVQTGSFGMLDTIASIAPKIVQKIFDKEKEEEKSLKFGERTFNDALIFEMLKDISNAQESDSKEKNVKYKGKDDNMYSDAFLNYLKIRDYITLNEFVEKRLKDFMNSTGILDYIADYTDVIENMLKHHMCLQGIGLIDEYQTYLDNELFYLEKGNWKVNQYGPTHTQLAKDSALHPLHPLAVELAQEAVFKVGELFLKNDFRKQIIEYAQDILFQHPMYTSWMDEQVIDWCKKNKPRVLLSRQPSIILLGIRHGYQEMANLYKELSKMRDYEVSKTLEKSMESIYNKIPEKWNKGWEKLNELNEKYGQKSLKIKKQSQSYADFMKSMSHSH